jgi:bifunctional non-homologous end joining protein LigD
MARHTDPLDVLDESERAGLPAREPDFVEPMLALLTHGHFSDPDWLYERKLDGELNLDHSRGAMVGLASRRW